MVATCTSKNDISLDLFILGALYSQTYSHFLVPVTNSYRLARSIHGAAAALPVTPLLSTIHCISEVVVSDRAEARQTCREVKRHSTPFQPCLFAEPRWRSVAGAGDDHPISCPGHSSVPYSRVLQQRQTLKSREHIIDGDSLPKAFGRGPVKVAVSGTQAHGRPGNPLKEIG